MRLPRAGSRTPNVRPHATWRRQHEASADARETASVPRLWGPRGRRALLQGGPAPLDLVAWPHRCPSRRPCPPQAVAKDLSALLPVGASLRPCCA